MADCAVRQTLLDTVAFWSLCALEGLRQRSKQRSFGVEGQCSDGEVTDSEVVLVLPPTGGGGEEDDRSFLYFFPPLILSHLLVVNT